MVTGIKYSTLYSWIERTEKKCAALPQGTPGWNADRHACRSCQYRAKGHKGCDYYILTNKERGGDAADCKKYTEGDRIKKIQD